ncbi:MAG: rhomboid family intramembrane serine protease [Nanoarchaeota archaeon]|nr:rhomboid family intramembrane serine protease [Nanoarchaeota archaeon]MBU0977814.1 rhomboid family intramembrane serine protease [Nanoarchaeota archaeon]
MRYRIHRKKSNPLEILSLLSTTVWVILVTTIISLFGFIVFAFFPNYIDYISLKPENIMHGKYLWTLVTHMFVHAGFFHLFVNMFSLYFLGSLTERIIGRKRFLWFYILAGIFAGALTAYLSFTFGNTDLGMRVLGNPAIPMVGASGAIFGLLGILTILIPRTKLYLIAGPIIVILAQYLLGAILPGAVSIINIVATALIFIMLFSIFSFKPGRKNIALPITLPLWAAWIVAIIPLVALSIFVELPIGNIAHFGGFIAGIIFGLYLKSKYKRKVEKLQRMFR